MQKYYSVTYTTVSLIYQLYFNFYVVIQNLNIYNEENFIINSLELVGGVVLR